VATIFFSYAQDDRGFASELGQALNALGHEVWVGTETLLWGESLFDRTQAALKGSDAIVLLLTTASLKSQWLAFELGAAVVQGKKVIPIQIGEFEVPLGFPIQQFHRIVAELSDVRKVAQQIHSVLGAA
jgi:hypothetical protein